MDQTRTLDPSWVIQVFEDCILKKDECDEEHIMAEGVMYAIRLHKERLESHDAEITAMLAELPDTFRQNFGGGGSFLNACVDRHGNLWSGDHMTVEQLLLLGLASGKVTYCVRRDLWPALPSCMPYFVILEKFTIRADRGSS